jgi:hypothetical protein
LAGKNDDDRMDKYMRWGSNTGEGPKAISASKG